jgi:hypothetical protein
VNLKGVAPNIQKAVARIVVLPLPNLARTAGLEPTTYGLEGLLHNFPHTANGSIPHHNADA